MRPMAVHDTWEKLELIYTKIPNLHLFLDTVHNSNIILYLRLYPKLLNGGLRA